MQTKGMAKIFFQKLREATHSARSMPGLEDLFLKKFPEWAGQIEELKIVGLRLLLASALDEAERVMYAPKTPKEQWFRDLLDTADAKFEARLGRPLTQDEKSAVTHGLFDALERRRAHEEIRKEA